MPRAARIVLPGQPHHVVQRGNRRLPTFFCPADYEAYRMIAVEAFAEARVQVWAYCLMPNHVHLIATPETSAGLALALGATHQRYTWRINQKQGWTGRLWQGRFGSFPMDEPYLRLCARYVGLNPVRARLARKAIDWPWSSVRAHVTGAPDPLLSRAPLANLVGDDMAEFFDADVSGDCRQRFREALDTGRPLLRLKAVSTVGDTPKGVSPALPAASSLTPP